MLLEDGRGSGRKAGVTADNELLVEASVISRLEDLNVNFGEVWTIPIDAVAPSGATKFLYLLNNGSETLGVAAIRLAASVAGVYRITKVMGTAAGGTVVTSVPLNLSSTTPVPGGAQSGATITGLTDAGLLLSLVLVANTMLIVDLPERWYLPPNTAIAIQAPGAATVNGSLVVFQSELE